jgi:hypothetical protein
MPNHLNRGKSWPSSSDRNSFGTLESVTSVSFCEMTRCIKLASWRIGSGAQSVAFCPKHTLATMRDSRLWLG